MKLLNAPLLYVILSVKTTLQISALGRSFVKVNIPESAV